jgi:pimeloyl-ACP methyl ester carboxylesterase
MPHVTASDGTKLYYESTGPDGDKGPAIVFVHELAGSHRSFDAQVAALKGNYRCVVYNARGYPPSDIPWSVDSYSQEHAASDIADLLDGLSIGNAHVAGVSMGSASALQFALKHPHRVRSLILCAIGTGSDQSKEEFEGAIEGMAQQVEKLGLHKYGENFANSPNRKTLRDNNPKEYDAFLEQYSSGSVLGMTNTMRGVQKRRAPLYVHKDRVASLQTPTLVVVGEKDAPCRKPSEFLRDTMPSAKLEVVEGAGHAVNLEKPAVYNRLVNEFLDSVEAKGSTWVR